MNAHVAGQLIRAREALLTGQKCALVWAFTSVGADMTGLMLKTMKGFRADMAFVRTGGIRSTGSRR